MSSENCKKGHLTVFAPSPNYHLKRRRPPFPPRAFEEKRRENGSHFDPLGPVPPAAKFLSGPIAEEHEARREAFITLGVRDWWSAVEFAHDAYFITAMQWGTITRFALRLRSRREAFLASLRSDLAMIETPIHNRTLRRMLNDARRAVMRHRSERACSR
jgi:hypothetical protein